MSLEAPPHSQSLPEPPKSRTDSVPPPPPGLSAPPTLDNLLEVIRVRWPVMLLAGLVAFAVGAAGGWFLTPGKYTTSVDIELPQLQGLNEGGSELDAINFQKGEAARLKGPMVLSEVLSDPEVKACAEVRNQADPWAWLSKDLVTDITTGTNRIKVSLSGEYPQDLALILDRIVQEYGKEFDKKMQTRLKQQSKQLEKQKEQAAEKLHGMRLTLLEMEARMKVEPQDKFNQRLNSLNMHQFSLQTGLDNLLPQLRKDEADLRQIEVQIKDPEKIRISKFDVDQEMQRRPVVAERLKDMLALESDIQRRIANGGPNALGLRGDRGRLEQMKQAMGNLHQSIESGLREKALEDLEKKKTQLQSDIKLRQDEIASKQSKFEQTKTDLSRLIAGSAPPAVQAERDRVNLQELSIKQLGERIANVEVQAAMLGKVEFPRAPTPTARKLDRKFKMGGVAGVGLFGLAAFAVAMLQFTKRHVYNSNDVSRGLGLTVVGGLPDLSANQPAMTEAVDSLRVMLLHAAKTENLRSFVVTSPEVGEGKTTLACGLASSLAHCGYKTLLMDCDLREPTAHDRFDLPRGPGLSEVLRGEAVLDTVIHPTAVEGLALLPAGQADRHAIQALTRDDLSQMLKTLREHFDFIIIDSSPVLPVADTIQLAQHADAVLLAALRGVSRLPAIYAAQQRLGMLGIRIVGAVLAGDRASSYGYQKRS